MSDRTAAMDAVFSAIGNVRERLTERGPATGYVYVVFASGDGDMKVGYTAGDPRLRVASLQTGNHRHLILATFMPGNLATESLLHERLMEFHVRGEWFRRTPESSAIVEEAILRTAALNNHWEPIA